LEVADKKYCLATVKNTLGKKDYSAVTSAIMFIEFSDENGMNFGVIFNHKNE
jgi:hypothetical protein